VSSWLTRELDITLPEVPPTIVPEAAHDQGIGIVVALDGLQRWWVGRESQPIVRVALPPTIPAQQHLPGSVTRFAENDR